MLSIIFVKEILLVTLFIFIAYNYATGKQLFYIQLLFLLVSILFIMLCFFYSISIGWNTENVRRLILIPLFIILAITLSRSRIQPSMVFPDIGYYIIVTGCIFDLFLRDHWVDLFDIVSYWNYFQSDQFDSVFQTGRLYTNEFFFLGFFNVPRLVGFSLDPTMLAALLLGYLNFYTFYKIRKGRANLCILLGILTFSKLFVLGILINLIFRFFNISLSKLICILILLIPIASFLVVEHGANSHVRGIISGWEIATANPLGKGIGLAGNRSGMPGTGNGELGGESGLGNFIAQMGFLGLLAIVPLVFNKQIRSRLTRMEPRSRSSRINKKFYASGLFFFFLAYLYSASSLSFTYGWILVLPLFLEKIENDSRNIY